jgi:DNA repair exonuclease SbcCD ATPase subunit
MRGITGIFGANASGKSSIIGAMMFGLFNTTDRGPVKAAHIINRTKTAGSVEILFNVAGTDYVLRREVAKSRTKKGIDHDKAAGKLYLARVDMSGNEVELNTENAETRNDTDKVIRNLIGSSQDYLMTGLAAQGEMNRFIKEGATARKQMISRFLDLKVYEDIFKLANDDLNTLNARSQRFKGIDFVARIAHLCSEHSRLELESADIKEDIAVLEEELAEVKAWLLNHNSSKADEVVARKSKSDKVLADAERAVNSNQSERDALVLRAVDLDRRLVEKNSQLAALEDEASLAQKKDMFQALNVKLMAARSNETLSKTMLRKQEESVKRLKLVPCGDQYLDSCKYIAGAKEDREQLERTNADLAAIVVDINNISDEINKLHAENIEAAIKQRQGLQRELADISSRLETTKNEKEFKLRLFDASVERLNTLRSDHAEITREHDLLLSKIEEISDKQAQQKQLQTELNAAKDDLQKNTKALGAISNQLLVIEQDKLEAEKLLSEQKVLDAICVAFSKNAIPAMVIESALPFVNAELDNILGGVAPFRVYLKTEVGNSNVLDVYIEDDNSPRVIELASGMEKMIASLALRVALINLSRLPKPDFLVIDEGWDVLDGINVSRAIDLLNSLKTKFKNILVISHVDALKEAADDFISIQNNSGSKSSYVCY